MKTMPLTTAFDCKPVNITFTQLVTLSSVTPAGRDITVSAFSQGSIACAAVAPDKHAAAKPKAAEYAALQMLREFPNFAEPREAFGVRRIPPLLLAPKAKGLRFQRQCIITSSAQKDSRTIRSSIWACHFFE